MRRFVNSFVTRTFAFILAVLAVLAFAFSGYVTLLLADHGDYRVGESLKESVLDYWISYQNYEVQELYSEYLINIDSYDVPFEETGEFDVCFGEKNSNYFFTATDKKGNLLFGNYDAESQASMISNWRIVIEESDTLQKVTKTFASKEECDKYLLNFGDESKRINSVERTPIISETDGSIVGYTCLIEYYQDEVADIVVYGNIRADLTAEDNIKTSISIAEWLLSISTAVLWICPISALMFILLTVLLCFGAGRKNGVEGVYLTWIDKVPIDLVIAIATFFTVMLSALAIDCFEGDWLYRRHYYQWLELAVGAVAVAAIAAMVLWVITAIAARLKTPKWWRNTVIAQVLRAVKRAVFFVFRLIKTLLKKLPLYWKAAAIFGAASFVEIIGLVYCASYNFRPLPFLWFVEKVLLGLVLVVVVILLRRLQKGAEEISEGNLDYKIDKTYMPPVLSEHAERLNTIGMGLSKAVDERMKSERMKTELITNVSHDIKTPLTSIVNYVDLLKMEPIESQTAQEYISVIDRQSARLKKLITDLVEASKASTGNLSTNMEPTDLKVLISQTVGEYEEKLAERSLELVTETDESNPVIMADGRLMWRVFDNLFNNICKYAMKGTRVYLTMRVEGSKATVSLKNISSSRLNIASEELMERFVRGDSSRNTEGSGLGLSIAKSLVELQKGDFDIVIDGDLFKVTVSFDVMSLR